jgi:hypothetical protein
MGAGVVRGLEEAREIVGRSVVVERYEPCRGGRVGSRGEFKP